MDISRHISSLLFEHECVIVPGLGGFVSNYQPAKIHPVQHMFQPPSKTILFNPELKSNDGLLANAIAEIENITYPVALAIIAKFSKDTLAAIRAGEKIKLDKIGELSQGIESNIIFRQDEKSNFNKETFGLSSFVSPMIERTYHKPLPKLETKFVNRREETSRPRKNKRLAGWALLIIPLLFFAGWMSMKTQFWNGMPSGKTHELTSIFQQKATDNIEKHSIAENITQENNGNRGDKEPRFMESETASFLPELNNAENLPDTEVKDTEKNTETEIAATPPEPVPEKVVTKKMYHLIGGSFENIKNAESLILSCKAQGYDNSQVIGQASNGFYRVSIAAYIRKPEALAELKKVREGLNPNAWLLRQ